jgi:hypothetical protein
MSESRGQHSPDGYVESEGAKSCRERARDEVDEARPQSRLWQSSPAWCTQALSQWFQVTYASNRHIQRRQQHCTARIVLVSSGQAPFRARHLRVHVRGGKRKGVTRVGDKGRRRRKASVVDEKRANVCLVPLDQQSELPWTSKCVDKVRANARKSNATQHKQVKGQSTNSACIEKVRSQ